MGELVTLQLEGNLVTEIDSLSHLTKLQTLNLAGNHLTTVEKLQHLKLCHSITNLDISNNKIEDPTGLLELLQEMPNLAVLILKGNNCLQQIKHYRKTFIANLPKLKYLDDRPVFDDDRRCAEAWFKGGFEAEREERQKIKDEKKARDDR